MWIVGDWGQASPWTRNTGVMMAKGENDVWTGKLSLPKGTEFNIRILKSTVSTTSGGNNVWSAVRYASTLNNSASHDFGEFTDNLIPNGNFDEGAVKWTPSDSIIQRDFAVNGDHLIVVGDKYPNVATSDTFVIPPNQDLRFSAYVYTWMLGGYCVIEVKDVDTQSALFKTELRAKRINTWEAFSETLKTGGSPVTAQIVCTNRANSHGLDAISLVTP